MLSAKINSMMGFLVQSGLMDSAEGREIACPLIAEMEDACKMALRMERMQVGVEAIAGRIEEHRAAIAVVMAGKEAVHA